MSNTQIRIPRPIGTTHLGIQSHTHKTEESLNILKNHLYSHYINTNYQYNGIPLTITQFATTFNLDLNELNQYIYQQNNLSYKLLTEKGQQDLYGVVLNMALSGVLSDRSAAEQQLHILQQSQNGTYTPFVSGEVNKAIAQVQSNTAQMVNLIRVFGGNQGLSININNNNGQQTQQNYVTVESVHELIEAKPDYVALQKDQDSLEHLYTEYLLEDMPEVDATKQIGFDTSKEGLSFGKVLVIEEDEENGHEDRRAREIEMDLEDDDNL